MEPKRLYRSRTDRVIGGVAGGLAEYMNIDPIIIRIILVVLAFAGAGFVIFLYILGWVIIPEAPGVGSHSHRSDSSPKDAGQDLREKVNKVAHEFRETTERYTNRKAGSNGQMIGGSILLVIGGLFLLNNVLGYDVWTRFWPLILIVIGIMLLVRGDGNGNRSKGRESDTPPVKEDGKE